MPLGGKLEDIDYKNAFKFQGRKIKTNSKDDRSEDEKSLFLGDLSNNVDDWIKYHSFLQHRNDRTAERDLKCINAKNAYRVCIGWCLFIAVFILLHGFSQGSRCLKGLFILKSNEFMFICGTLTSAVFIFYLKVIRNLFPNRDNNDKKNSIWG